MNRSLICDYIFRQICIIKAIPKFLEFNAFSIKTIPLDLLSLKQLTSKTLALIAITSDRVQAIHLVNFKKIHIAHACISFILTNKLAKNYQVNPKLVICANAVTKTWMLKV